MRVGAQKCFLRQILCLLAISLEIERNAIGLLFVPLHKFLESLVIPFSSQGHEIFISGLHSWTPTHRHDYTMCESREMAATPSGVGSHENPKIEPNCSLDYRWYRVAARVCRRGVPGDPFRARAYRL